MKAKLVILAAVVFSSCTSFATARIDDPNDAFSPRGQAYMEEKANTVCAYADKGNHSDTRTIAASTSDESLTQSNSKLTRPIR